MLQLRIIVSKNCCKHALAACQFTK
ncbi:MAG: SWIM zinc finger family protein [Lachnospiraceae bacterium]